MRTIFLLIALAIGATATAQGREHTFKTDSGTVVIHYFTNGKVSTKAWMDTNDRWGRSWAYDVTGKEIFSYQTRRIAGHASADFSYHPNGAVSRIEVSDAPDGGIQWYRSTTTYDGNGVKTGFTEQGRDNDGIIPGPGVRVTEKPEVTVPFKQEVVEEQRMYITEVFVLHTLKTACFITVNAVNPSPALPGGQYTVVPRDTLRVGAYSRGEVFDAPSAHMTITGEKAQKKRKRTQLAILRTDMIQVSPEHRRYFVLMEKAK